MNVPVLPTKMGALLFVITGQTVSVPSNLSVCCLIPVSGSIAYQTSVLRPVGFTKYRFKLVVVIAKCQRAKTI